MHVLVFVRFPRPEGWDVETDPETAYQLLERVRLLNSSFKEALEELKKTV